MEEYDKAAHRFYSALDLKSLPLISWDIYGSYFDTLCKNYDDIEALRRLSINNKWSYTSEFKEALIQKEHIILVTDPQLTIVHATYNIAAMNGYFPGEIIGRKPKMFQGVKTDRKITQNIGKAVRKQLPFEAVITNYRKDGSTYNCWIRGEPIYNVDGKLVNFIAYEKEVA